MTSLLCRFVVCGVQVLGYERLGFERRVVLVARMFAFNLLRLRNFKQKRKQHGQCVGLSFLVFSGFGDVIYGLMCSQAVVVVLLLYGMTGRVVDLRVFAVIRGRLGGGIKRILVEIAAESVRKRRRLLERYEVVKRHVVHGVMVTGVGIRGGVWVHIRCVRRCARLLSAVAVVCMARMVVVTI